MKTWKKGQLNPETNLIFWAYQDKAHTTERWFSKEEYEIKLKNNIEYQRSRYTSYNKKRYLANREMELERRKTNWAKRNESDPLQAMLYSVRSGARNRKIVFNITLDDIIKTWDRHNGICYYTKIPMLKKWKSGSPYQMSLDRIDSKRGYEVDNIVFCCQSINFAKSSYSEELFREFILAISKYNICSDQFKPKWIDVKKHLPKNKQRILIFCKREFNNSPSIVVGYYQTGDYENFISHEFVEDERADITHWMPLPQNP